MSVEFDGGSPGKLDSKTLSRETLSRWTGRISLSLSIYIYIYVYVSLSMYTYMPSPPTKSFPTKSP